MTKLIVSFTSYPGRINSVKDVLNSLYAQTLRADEIILWLAEEEFPQKEADLPAPLLEDLAAGLFTLRWCDNLGSHKKYFYAMQENPNDIIVTVDDDTFYHPDSLQKLFDAHTRFPNAVAAQTVALVQLDEAFEPLPVIDWLFDFRQLSEPSMLLMGIGVGGILYPPNTVDKRIFDKQLVLNNCSAAGRLCGDDILLKVGELLKGTPVVFVENKPYYRLPETQQTALSSITPQQNYKDAIIERLRELYRDSFDGQAAERLKRAIAEFAQADARGELIRRYWQGRPALDIEKQIGYTSLPGFSRKPSSSDHAEIGALVKFAARVFLAHQSKTPEGADAEAISALRKQVSEIPGIREHLQGNIALRALVEYGALLSPGTRVIYHGVPIHMLGLENWLNFLQEHPERDPEYGKRFQKYLTGMNAAVRNTEELSPADIEAWDRAYQAAAREYVKSDGFIISCLKKLK